MSGSIGATGGAGAAAAGGTDASSAGGGSTTPPGPTDWSGAIQRVRDTAATIVKGFVAIGTLLIGSGPLLAHLENLHANSRGILALLAAGIALIGVGVVIWLAADVNLTQVTDISELLERSDPVLKQLLDRIEKAPLIDVYLSGYSLSALLVNRRNAVEALESETQALATVTGDAAVKEVQGLIATSTDNIRQIDSLLSNVAGWANYERVRRRFERARPRMFLAAAATVVAGVAVWLGLLGGAGASTNATSSSTA